MRKLSWVFLLPLVLLFAQQARVHHEIGHLAALGAPHSQQQQPEGGEPGHCELCLSFAHIASAVGGDALPPALRLDLAFHHGAEAPVTGAPAPAPAHRSRGPPRFS